MEKLYDTQTLAEQYLITKSDKDFKILYERLLPGLKNHIRKLIPDSEYDKHDIINDILENVFLKVLLNIHMYNTNWKFTTWVYTIARNETLIELDLKHKQRCYSWLKERTTNDTEEDNIPSISIWKKTQIDNTDHLIEQERETMTDILLNKILTCINNLSDIYKYIIVDREIYKLSYEEIADKYCLPLNTVKSRIKLGKENLQLSLDNNIRKLYQTIFYTM